MRRLYFVIIILLVIGVLLIFVAPYTIFWITGEFPRSYPKVLQVPKPQTTTPERGAASNTAANNLNRPSAPSTPQFIKAVTVGMDELGNAREVAKKIRSVGANTVMVVLVAPIDVPYTGTSPAEVTEGAQSMVREAYSQGLAVGISIDMLNPYEKEKITYDYLMPRYLEYIREYAAFAEEHQVAFLEVTHEADNILRIGRDEGRTNELLQTFLTAAKEKYSNRIGVGFDMCQQATIERCPLSSFSYDVTGYSFTDASIYIKANDTELSKATQTYIGYLDPILSRLEKINGEYEVSQIHFDVNAGSIWSAGIQGCEEMTKLCAPLTTEQEATFYEHLLPEAHKYAQQISVPYYTLNNQQAKQAIQDVYNSF